MWKYFVLFLSISGAHVIYFNGQPYSGAYPLGRKATVRRSSKGSFAPLQASGDLPFPERLSFLS